MFIKQLLHAPEFHCLQLVAGASGINRQLSGINVIESKDLISFCRPNELIITTGVQMKDDYEQLEQLIRQSHEKNAAGFIVNIGPYIQEIPSAIIQFANEQHFPLFLLEWKYRVADLLKNTIEFLSSEQVQLQNSDQKLLYNLIFRYDHPRIDIKKHLQQRGMSVNAEFGVITCTMQNSEQSIAPFEQLILQEFRNRYHDFLYLKQHNELIFLINRADVKTTSIPFSKTIEKLYEKALSIDAEKPLVVGMGNFYSSIHKIAKSYDQSKTVIHLVRNHKNPFILKYKEIGTYKIIMSFQDQHLLKTFHQDILGQVYFYDQLHNADFSQFLRMYLEENGSVSAISKRLFVHRNTVTYKINKIEALLDIDLTSTFARTNLHVAFMIEDVLKQRQAASIS